MSKSVPFGQGVEKPPPEVSARSSGTASHIAKTMEMADTFRNE
jgi:hypothetical protein